MIEHGIPDPGRLYTGEREEMGIVVNEPVRRGRVTGTDLLPGFAGVGPLRVFGMGTEHLPGALNLKGLGLGEERLRIAGDVPASQPTPVSACCRLYVHPLRWTSLGLALLEAMHLGMPVLALGTTEAYRAVPRGAGLVSTDVDELQRFARRLLNDPDDAYAMGLRAREAALERYGLDAFLRAWDELLGDLRTRGAPHQPQQRPVGAPRSAPPSHDAERTHP